MIRPALFSLTYPRSKGDDVSIFVRELVNEYSEQGISGIVVTPLDYNEPTREKDGRFTVHRFRYGIFSKGSLAYGAGLRENISRHPVLLLQTPMLFFLFIKTAFSTRNDYTVIHAIGLPAAFVASVMKFLTSKKYIVSLIDSDRTLLGHSLVDKLWNFAIQKADNVTTENVILKEAFSFKNRDEPVQIIPKAIPDTKLSQGMIDTYATSNKLHQLRPFLLAVTPVTPESGIDFLVSMLDDDTIGDCRLIVVGEIRDKKYHKELCELIERKRYTERVLFTGYHPPNIIVYYLRLAKAYVSASTNPSENTLLLAMSNRLPCAVNNHPAHEFHILHGTTGFLFSRESKAEAYFSIAEAVEGKRRARVIEAARTYAQQFSGEHTADRFIGILKKL